MKKLQYWFDGRFISYVSKEEANEIAHIAKEKGYTVSYSSSSVVVAR